MDQERPPLEEMTLRQLRRVASEYNISRYSRMRKSQLIMAIEQAMQGENPNQDTLPPSNSVAPLESEQDSFSTPPNPVVNILEEQQVEASKFELGQDDQMGDTLASVDEGLGELPAGYGESRIVLLPRDPQWAYAYWDVPNEKKEEMRRQGGQQLALRIYDVTDISLGHQSSHSVQEYLCDELAREWYLPIPVSDRDYVLDIGYRCGDGRWLILARSLPVHIPPVYPSDWIEDVFITVGWEEELVGKTKYLLVPPGKQAASMSPIYEKIYDLTEDAEAQRVAGSLFGSMQHVAGSVVSSHVSQESSYTLQETTSSYGVSSYGLQETTSSYGVSSYGLQETTSSYGVSSYGLQETTSSYGVSSYGLQETTSSYGVSSYGLQETVSSYGLSSYGVGSYSLQESSYALQQSLSSYALSSYALSSYALQESSYALQQSLSSYALSSYALSSYALQESSYALQQSLSSYALSSYTLSSYALQESSYALQQSLSSYALSSYALSSYALQESSYALQQSLSSYALSSYALSSYALQESSYALQQSLSSYALSSYALSSYVFPSGAGLWAAPEMMTMSGAGLTMSGVGFSASAPPIRPRKFWLVADAELIVYGATEPDATVTIGGRPVKLNPDGTFRFQMSFQDGLIDYPIVAVAVDGEQTRSIHMKFTRETPSRHTNTKEDAVLEWLT